MAAVSAILAHQGGWDEMLLVLGPIVVIIGILAVVTWASVRQRSRERPNT